MLINEIKSIKEFKGIKELKEPIKLDKFNILIGKNNSGKTSFLLLLNYFLNNTAKFNFNDFNIEIQKKIGSG